MLLARNAALSFGIRDFRPMEYYRLQEREAPALKERDWNTTGAIVASNIVKLLSNHSLLPASFAEKPECEEPDRRL